MHCVSGNDTFIREKELGALSVGLPTRCVQYKECVSDDDEGTRLVDEVDEEDFEGPGVVQPGKR
jgi:hypothetical protein